MRGEGRYTTTRRIKIVVAVPFAYIYMQTVTYIYIRTTLALCRRERKSNFGSFYHVNARVRPPPAPPRNLAVNAPETDFHPLVADKGGSEQIKRSATVD